MPECRIKSGQYQYTKKTTYFVVTIFPFPFLYEKFDQLCNVFWPNIFSFMHLCYEKQIRLMFSYSPYNHCFLPTNDTFYASWPYQIRAQTLEYWLCRSMWRQLTSNFQVTSHAYWLPLPTTLHFQSIYRNVHPYCIPYHDGWMDEWFYHLRIFDFHIRLK